MRSHVSDDVVAEFAARDFGGAFHEARESTVTSWLPMKSPYDLARLMEGATEVACSKFGDNIIAHM